MGTFTAVALDPGGTTGWATYRAQHMELLLEGSGGLPREEWHEEEWNCGYLDRENHHMELRDLLGMMHTSEYYVITESFEFRNTGRHRDKVELISREYIGVAELFTQDRRVPFIKQTAAKGKITKSSFVRKANLQALGLWQPGREWVHSMDAYGHLLFWLIHGQFRRVDLLRRGGW
jgi:hypothetical protein